jgi:hypothetical protein
VTRKKPARKVTFSINEKKILRKKHRGANLDQQIVMWGVKIYTGASYLTFLSSQKAL